MQDNQPAPQKSKRKDPGSSRVYGGESTEDRMQRRRDQFLDAGLQLFGTVGFRGASVRALCREAKLTDRYFYESFASVEDVLVAVYEREVQRIVQGVFEAIRDIEPGIPVDQVARPALTAFFEGVRNPLVAKTMWFEILGVSDRVNKVYQQTLKDFGDMLLAMIRSLYPNRSLNETQEMLLSTSIVGAIGQSAMGWIIDGFSHAVEDLVEVNIMILEGLALRLELH